MLNPVAKVLVATVNPNPDPSAQRQTADEANYYVYYHIQYRVCHDVVCVVTMILHSFIRIKNRLETTKREVVYSTGEPDIGDNDGLNSCW